MYTTLLTKEFTDVHESVLATLDKAAAWPRSWAEHQYVGLVLSAMCAAVLNDPREARQYGVLRVMEAFMEHRHDLLPASLEDFQNPRSRVARLAIAEYKDACEPWIDILEYIQLRNWRRKTIYDDPARIADLREQISRSFSEELVAEIEEGTEDWWAG